MNVSNGSLFTEAKVTIPDTNNDDPRIGHLLAKDLNGLSKPWAVLIGFPSDEGVRRNNGRTGAAQAPDVIRNQLFRLTPDVEQPDRFSTLLRHMADSGNLNVTGDVERDQVKLGETVAEYLNDGIVPIILGGGHETAYGHFLGYAGAGKSCRIFNLDAHADVRPLVDGKAHSGSPFRQALEHKSGLCTEYVVAGLQSHSMAAIHRSYLQEKGCRYFMREELNQRMFRDLFGDEFDPTMVTFDMDAVDQAYAPAVSAPAANGLSPDVWLYAARLAGRSKAVASFDLVEINPIFDRDHQTARLGALTIWHFLSGLARRKWPLSN